MRKVMSGRVVQILVATLGEYRVLKNIVIQLEYEGEIFTCVCGTGFTATERSRFGEDKTLILGKNVDIVYNDIVILNDDTILLDKPIYAGLSRDVL